MDTLLTKIYRDPAKVRDLFAQDSAARFNVPSESSHEDVWSTLIRALQRGCVAVRRPGENLVTVKEMCRALESFDERGGTMADAEVHLTPKGGRLWENKADPAWQYFLNEAEPKLIKGRVWIFFEALDRDWLRCADETLRRFGFFVDCQRRLRTRRNWRPLYWKPLRLGYCLGINTGVNSTSEQGKKLLQGLNIASERLGSIVSVLSSVWDAKWIARIGAKRNQESPA